MQKDELHLSPQMQISEFYKYYLKLNKDEVEKVAHQPQDMIKYCAFAAQENTKDCSEFIKGSIKMFSPTFGVCYVYNFKGIGTNRPSQASVYGGPEFGLELIFDVERAYCLPKILLIR